MDEKPSTKTPSPERLEAYLSQVLMRTFNASPGLASYIESYRVVKDGVEVSFFQLPAEVLVSVAQVFAVADVEQFRYTKRGQPCVGFRAKPTAEDLVSLAVDDGEDHQGADLPDADGTTRVEVDANRSLRSPDADVGSRGAPPI